MRTFIIFLISRVVTETSAATQFFAGFNRLFLSFASGCSVGVAIVFGFPLAANAIDTEKSAPIASTAEKVELPAPEVAYASLEPFALAQNYFESFVDLSNFPLNLVNAVEISKDGGSALYGSDAAAGIVNIHLKNYLQGSEVDFRVGKSTRGDRGEIRFFGATGFEPGDWQGVVAYSGSYQEGIKLDERSFGLSSNQETRGGQDKRSVAGPEPSIVIPLTSSSSPSLAVPSGGYAASADLVTITDPMTNGFNYNPYVSLIPESTRHAAYYKWREQNGPGSGWVNLAGYEYGKGRSYPEWRLRSTLRLNTLNWLVSGTLKYIHDYEQYHQAVARSKIGAWTSFDLSLERRLSESMQIRQGFDNLFDRAPPFINYSPGYDWATHDPTGRYVYQQLSYWQ